MRIEIDPKLLKKAQVAAGAATPRETVEFALRLLVEDAQQKALDSLRGIGWEGDLDEIRQVRAPE